MITGEHKSKVDKLWTTFWNNGISNPLSVIEQISYLIFIKRLDDLELMKEKKANRLGRKIENPTFGKKEQAYRWSHFAAENDPAKQYEIVSNGAFPFIKQLHGDSESAYSVHMKDAIFMLRSPELLSNVIEQIDALPFGDKDIKGDIYEYMLSKLNTAGQAGQFRTPRHIIKMMVQMLELQQNDTICDPACGTAGFLVASAEYLLESFPDLLLHKQSRDHFNSNMFSGFDFDSTMLRIGSMNMLLHGIEHPHIESRDSLSEGYGDVADRYTVVLANPPFKGSLDHDAVAKNLLQVVNTKKTELLFLVQMIRALKPGGRAAVIVPDGVLFGSSKAHQAVRKLLVDDHKLDGVISLPSGVFKPYAGVSTAILLFTKTNSGGTDHVFFYEVDADGYSLDDKREKVKDDDLPDALVRWKKRNAKKDTDRTAKHFMVPVKEIEEKGFDLSINRYKETRHEEVVHEPPKAIIARLRQLESEIAKDLDELEAML